jgi:hypothetical protein
MDDPWFDEDEFVAPATPEEQRVAEIIWDTLEKIGQHASMGGDPRSGDMDVIFDGHFNLLLLARAVIASIR